MSFLKMTRSTISPITPKKKRVGGRKRNSRKNYKSTGRKFIGNKMVPCNKPGNDYANRYILANANVFLNEAYGCKIPDRICCPSTTFYSYDEYNFTVDGTYGGSAECFFPNLYNNIFYNATISSGSSWTWGASPTTSNASIYSDVVSGFSLIRPCAHGVKLSTALSRYTATGFVHICTFYYSAYDNTTLTGTPTSVGQMINCPNYFKIPVTSLCNSAIIYMNEPIDEGGYQYRDPRTTYIGVSATTANGITTTNLNAWLANTKGWAGICVFVEGAPISTNAVQIENLIHWEGLPKISSTRLETMTPAATPSSAHLDGASVIGNHAARGEAGSSQESYISGAARSLNEGFNSVVEPAVQEAIATSAYSIGATVGTAAVGAGVVGTAALYSRVVRPRLTY